MRDLAGALISPRTLHLGRVLVERFSRAAGLGRGVRGSPRIVLIGNCQAAAMARAMRLLCPEAEIRFRSAGKLGRRHRGPDEFAEGLSDTDCVFAQEIASDHLGPAHYAALAAEHPGYARIPAIVFAAFHPDLVYVGGPGVTRTGAFVNSPVGHYHSAIALYAFLQGFSVERTVRLFTREVFGYLGYLDLWEYAQETLLALGREAGMDLAPDLLRWSRRGCFMHSVNHPKMHVTADFARLLLTGAGIAFEDFELDSFLIDDLSLKGAWPVYEPIGRHYGVPGCYVFPQQATRRSPTPGRIFKLAAFVEGSFAGYRMHARSDLVSDRVESWLASDAVAVALRGFAV